MIFEYGPPLSALAAGVTIFPHMHTQPPHLPLSQPTYIHQHTLKDPTIRGPIPTKRLHTTYSNPSPVLRLSLSNIYLVVQCSYTLSIYIIGIYFYRLETIIEIPPLGTTELLLINRLENPFLHKASLPFPSCFSLSSTLAGTGKRHGGKRRRQEFL